MYQFINCRLRFVDVLLFQGVLADELTRNGKNSAKAVVLLKAMANERRLQILCLLHNQELSVGELCSKLELSQSALSQHLAWLRRDGLVNTRKEAQTVFIR